MPHTSEISSAVGTIRKMIACMINVIPLSSTHQLPNLIHRVGGALRPAVDSTREPTRLTREMELEIKVEEVLERLARDLPDRALADVCEDRIEELAGESCSYARGTVCKVYSARICGGNGINTHTRGSWSRLRSRRSTPRLCQRSARRSRS